MSCLLGLHSFRGTKVSSFHYEICPFILYNIAAATDRRNFYATILNLARKYIYHIRAIYLQRGRDHVRETTRWRQHCPVEQMPMIAANGTRRFAVLLLLDAVACANGRTHEKDRDIQRRWKRAIPFSFRTVTRRRWIIWKFRR